MILTQAGLAFTTGLMGAGHCIGMCGGLVAALALSPEGRRGGGLFHVLYHAGRVTTYGLIGWVVGWLGSAFAYTDAFREVSRLVLIGSDLFIILMGLGTAGAFRRLNVMNLDVPGPTRLLTAAAQRLRRLPPSLSALPLGLVMGFLPCGFVYAVAITAAQTASATHGALVLFAFGLGTIPALLFFGQAASWLGDRARGWMLRFAGLLVSVLGITNLIEHLRLLA